MKNSLRFRQVHLDFHTSPDIPAIGLDFDPDDFAETLKKAHVDSVTCFARCHHGLMYYNSKLNPERIHPHLKNRNLLRDQIRACHKRGIRVPIYTTVQWDEFTADEHREWLAIDREGREYGTKPFEAGFYRTLDILHPGYRAFLREHTREILETLPVDGLFFDIVGLRPSVAPHWIAGMDKLGLNPESELDLRRFCSRVIDEWKLEMTRFIRSINKECTIFYNAGHVGPRHRSTVKAYSHYELESLPSGGWGYTHFPLAMRYARGLGPDCLGMTGKFHTAWGDFGSFKNPAALAFECFHMLALNAKCSIGDQLHPGGRIDRPTYDLIGEVYGQVEKKQPWCDGAAALTDIGVLTPEEFAEEGEGSKFLASTEKQPSAAIGFTRILQELRHQFDILDSGRDFSKYRLLILPDRIPVDAALRAKLKKYLAGGGRILASYASGLDAAGERFVLDELGVTFKGEAPFSPDFIVPGKALSRGLRDAAHVMYLRGMKVSPARGARTLARVQVPYFNRTWRHFCSHRHTPSSGEAAYPGVVRSAAGNAIYFAHPIFTQYHENAPLWCKQLVANAIDLLLPPSERVLQVDGPSTLLATVNEQRAQKRRVVHLLHYLPERRGAAFDVVEDVIPLHDLPVSVKTKGRTRSVRLVPDGEPLEFAARDGRVSFVVPRVEGHAMIEIA